ncbi:hypothetical protein Btru_059777 [Bulinus truncatus]|nr:hypothetical protein Btru_059777 [Bulinus truncatus]
MARLGPTPSVINYDAVMARLGPTPSIINYVMARLGPAPSIINYVMARLGPTPSIINYDAVMARLGPTPSIINYDAVMARLGPTPSIINYVMARLGPTPSIINYVMARLGPTPSIINYDAVMARLGPTPVLSTLRCSHGPTRSHPQYYQLHDAVIPDLGPTPSIINYVMARLGPTPSIINYVMARLGPTPSIINYDAVMARLGPTPSIINYDAVMAPCYHGSISLAMGEYFVHRTRASLMITDLLPRIAVKDPVTHSTWEDGKFTSYLICIKDLLPRIAVKDPVTHSTWEDGKFTSYLICIKTNHPAFHLPMSAVRRRYSELVWLAKTLKSNHHYVNFPSMPPKTVLAERFDPAFIQERMKLIENYLNELLVTDTVLSDAAFHLFLQTDLTKEEMEEYFAGRLSEEFVESAWKNVGHVHTNPYVVNINTVPCEPQEIVMNEEDLKHNSRRISHSSASSSENGIVSFGAFANQPSYFSEQTVNAEVVPANQTVLETKLEPSSLSKTEHTKSIDSSDFESSLHALDTMKLTRNMSNQ